MIDILVWIMAYALEIVSANQLTMERWETMVTVAQAMVGPIWLIFAAQHSGLSDWLSPWRMLMALSPGLATSALALTNGWHHLLWESTTLITAPFSIVSPQPGPWFWGLAVYRYIYILIGTILIFVPLVRSPALRKAQGIMVALGGLLPMIGNALHIFDLTHVMLLDLGPFAFLASGILLSLGLFTFHMVELLPLAQSAILENIREGVIVLDNDGKVADLNPAARHLLDLQQHIAAPQMTLDALLSGSLGTQLAHSLEQDTTLSLQCDAETIWIRPQSYPLLARQGHTIGQLLVLYDVTEAHRLDELRDDLVHMMVHDLRNPLTIVQGSAELLAEDLDAAPPPIHQLIKMIQTSNAQCLELVNRILDVQMLEAGELTVERQPIHLAAFIREISAPLGALADQKQQTLTIEISSDMPPVRADPKLLQRILQNLIGNALKFTPKQGTIQVSAQRIQDVSQICIKDDGPGIAPDLAERLFQKFATGSSRQRGSGLGLAFCKLAVEAHGGHIWVETKQGQGSRFCFTLPLNNDKPD